MAVDDNINNNKVLGHVIGYMLDNSSQVPWKCQYITWSNAAHVFRWIDNLIYVLKLPSLKIKQINLDIIIKTNK